MNYSISKKIENIRNNDSSLTIITMIAFIYSLIVGSGIYGYGLDFTYAYSRGFDWSAGRAGFFDYLGFRIATFTINNFNLGVYLVTFIISISTGLLIREHMNFRKSSSLFLLLLVFIVAIHTWPIVMSTSNAMRQGLAMSFIFLALTSSLRKNFYQLMFFSLVGALVHKSAIIIIIIIIFSNILNKFLFSLSHFNKVIINFFIGIFLFTLAYHTLDLFYPYQRDTRVIGGDFRAAFVLISLVYLFLSFFYKIILNNSFNLSLYYYSFISFAPLIIGLNWQYERLGMIMIIPYIFSYGCLFNRRSYELYIVLIFLLFFFLTIYTGMFSALLPLAEFNSIFFNHDNIKIE